MNRITKVLGVVALLVALAAVPAQAQSINSGSFQSVSFSGSVSESLTLTAAGGGAGTLSYDGTQFWTSSPATVTATYNANNRQALVVYSGVVAATSNFNLAAWQEKVAVNGGAYSSYVSCNMGAGQFAGGVNVVVPNNSALPGGGTSSCSETFFKGSVNPGAQVNGTGSIAATYLYQYQQPNAPAGNYSVTVAYVAYLF